MPPEIQLLDQIRPFVEAKIEPEQLESIKKYQQEYGILAPAVADVMDKEYEDRIFPQLGAESKQLRPSQTDVLVADFYRYVPNCIQSAWQISVGNADRILDRFKGDHILPENEDRYLESVERNERINARLFVGDRRGFDLLHYICFSKTEIDMRRMLDYSGTIDRLLLMSAERYRYFYLTASD